jgi:hypothetical protein
MKLPGGGGVPQKPGWLRAHEGGPLAGHTISRHVGKTRDELSARLSSGTVSEASTFPSEHAAERFIGRALDIKSREIREWLSGTDDRLRLKCDLGEITGVTMQKNGDTVRPTGVRVILDKDPTALGGWRIKTAFPD